MPHFYNIRTHTFDIFTTHGTNTHIPIVIMMTTERLHKRIIYSLSCHRIDNLYKRAFTCVRPLTSSFVERDNV